MVFYTGTKKVQAFLRKWANRLSFSVTIDGNKELHDSCRVFPDGSPSYDIAVDAASDWMKRGNHMGSKITIAPGNISFLYDAIKHMVDLGYDEINANCVYEKGWTPVHATVLYDQMKRISDYFLEQNFDFERDFFCSLYNEDFFQPKDPDDLQSWCGGVGNSMIACDPQGRIFPCIRYMESSLNGEQEPYSIGDVDNGIGCTECYKCRINCMAKIDRRTQSTDECFYCPIAAGCSNCSGYDYQVNGTPDSKATYICVMHKARALGNLYFWNKYYRKNNMNKRMKNYVPDEWALEIISESELNMLKELEKRGFKSLSFLLTKRRLDIMAEIKGIDVSRWNGEIDWKTVANYGMGFAILRITEKGNIVDSTFEPNYKGCIENKIPVGVYKYSYATTIAQIEDEANVVIKTLNKRKLNYHVFLDIEDKCQENLSDNLMMKMIEAFRTIIVKAGYKFGIYCGYSWYQNQLPEGAKKYDCWVARYPNNDTGELQERLRVPASTGVIGWQYSSKATIPGIPTKNRSKCIL